MCLAVAWLSADGSPVAGVVGPTGANRFAVLHACLTSPTPSFETTLPVSTPLPLPLPLPHPPLSAQIPTIGFIYFAGWLGYAGSKYLQTVSTAAKPIEKEIIM